MAVPQQAPRMHIMEGFTASVGAGPVVTVFTRRVWAGALRRIVQEDNHQKVLLAVRRVYFVPSALKIRR